MIERARTHAGSDKPGQGYSLPLTGVDEPRGGIVLPDARDGDPRHALRRTEHDLHWETEQEDFLVLAGEAVLICEGQERAVRQWDFVHCPPETRHAVVGADDGPCVLLCASSRQFQKDGPWGFHCVDETAGRHNASSPEEYAGREHRLRALAPGAGDALSRRVAAGDRARQRRQVSRFGRASS